MSHDFIRDLLAILKKQGFQYHLITFAPDKDGGDIDIFENIEFQYAEPFIETLGESCQVLGENYIGFIKAFEKQMVKEAKKEAKKLAAKKEKT